MKRAFLLLLTLPLWLSLANTVEAKARLVAVFPLRSTPDIASKASEATRTITAKLAAVEGYDARIVPNPTSGTLGMTAASVGASIYIVGQLLATDAGYQVIIASFEAATDKPLGEYRASIKAVNVLPETPEIATLLSAPQQSALNKDNGANLSPRLATGAPSIGSVVGQGQDLNQEARVKVPTGLAIPLVLDAPISSGAAQVGDKFAFRAQKDIDIDGFVVVRKGAQGEGQVAAVERAGSNGHPGKLGLQFNWIAAIDGSKVQLTDTARSDEGEEKKGAASTATIATYLLLGPLGLFAHNFVKGRDITLDEKTKINAYVDHSVLVAKQTPETTEPGFAPPVSAVRPAPVGDSSLTLQSTQVRGNSGNDESAFRNLAGWSYTALARNSSHDVSQWSLPGGSGQPAQTLTLANDDGGSLSDSLARIKKNFNENHITPTADTDLSCQGLPSHIVEFSFGSADNEIVTRRLLISRTTGLTTVTYVRPKNVQYDNQVKKALDSFCAA